MTLTLADNDRIASGIMYGSTWRRELALLEAGFAPEGARTTDDVTEYLGLSPEDKQHVLEHLGDLMLRTAWSEEEALHAALKARRDFRLGIH